MGGINFLPYYATHTHAALEARIKHLSQERYPSREFRLLSCIIYRPLIQFFRFDTPAASCVSKMTTLSNSIPFCFQNCMSRAWRMYLGLFQESWLDQTDQVIWLMPSCPSRGAPSPQSPPPRPFTCPRSCSSPEPSITSCSETSQYKNCKHGQWSKQSWKWSNCQVSNSKWIIHSDANLQQYIICSFFKHKIFEVAIFNSYFFSHQG